MFNSKSYQKILIILSLLSIFVPITANAVPAKPSEPPNVNSQKPQSSKKANNNFLTTFRPPNKGQPQHTVGGATRGDSCAIDQENNSEITALVPEKEQSLTLESHPNFFAYVSPMNGDKSAILTVKDETEDYYYSQKLTLPATGGVIKMTLAEDAPPLKIGQSYKWFLRIQCNANLEPEDPQINATVTRIEGNIPSMDRENLVRFYTGSQIWYDSLDTAFALSQSGKDIYWSQLLNNVGMERFLTNEIIDF